jgi:hypothetical protein
MMRNEAHAILFSDYYARLRPAYDLIPAGQHQVGVFEHSLLESQTFRQALLRQVHKATAAQIIHVKQIMFLGELRQRTP